MTVDSSVLGAGCDGYEHRYEEVRTQDIDPAVFTADLGESSGGGGLSTQAVVFCDLMWSVIMDSVLQIGNATSAKR